jgi:hypothetical protein
MFHGMLFPDKFYISFRQNYRDHIHHVHIQPDTTSENFHNFKNQWPELIQNNDCLTICLTH